MTPAFTGEADADLATLRATFADWRIVRAGGRWWASRGPIVSEARTGANAIQADSAAALCRALEAARR